MPQTPGEHHYAEALDSLRHSYPDDDDIRHQAPYLLMAFGNALAAAQGWTLRGMDAIDFALMKQYGWNPLILRELSDREKAVALHETLSGLPLDDAGLKVWREHYLGYYAYGDNPTLEDLWYPDGTWSYP
ncbi:hypothetical protein [Billgrantia desiderata]|uniref:hypothetical protein n=1 Tax=Billgrantia desiderata TaxID=52021 RepID=UPI001F3876F4|nr:hypothetical protein [Halomonas desiderata]MCE8013901.1 hypothetical protein [Halomonas desiderata]